MITFLLIISLFSSCSGFLLPPNNTGGSALTDEHYLYIMGLLGQEKENVHKMEQFILKLNNEMKFLQQQVDDLNQRNGSSQEMADLKSGYNVLQTEYIKLQQEYFEMKTFNNTLKQELSQIQHELMEVKSDNFASIKYSERLQSEIYACRNDTKMLKTELESFTHSIAAGKLKNMTQIQSSVDNLQSKIDVNTKQLNALTSSSNARSQDFIALLNRTKNTQRKIEVLETETKQSLLGYQNITNQKFNDAFQRINSIDKKVSLTSCADETTFSQNSIMKFPYIKNVAGVSDVSAFRNSGKFTCEVAGSYLFSVFITSDTATSEFTMYKNNVIISLVYINSHSDKHWCTGTGIVAVNLNVGDTLHVTPYYDNMLVHGSDSCITIIKIR